MSTMRLSTHQAIEDFFRQYPLKHYKKGHILILSGETTEYAYYLVEGRIKLYDVTYRGEEITIHNYSPPSFIPLALILNASVTRYTYEASTDIAIYQVPVEDARLFLETHPSVVYDLFSNAYETIDGILERMVHFIASSAKNRLVYSLIVECKQFGQQRDDGSYIVAISEKELGARAGLSRETVSREARVLKIAKLIEVQHSTIVIPNLRRLERYLEIHT